MLFKAVACVKRGEMLKSELQAKLLKETAELYTRKQKVEDDIRNLEAATSALQRTAALRDIEAYRSQRFLPAKLFSR